MDKITDMLVKLLSRFIKFQKQPEYLRGKKTRQNKQSSLVWKQGDGWVQYNPPRHHPCYEEWMKLKEKEKENADGKVQER